MFDLTLLLSFDLINWPTVVCASNICVVFSGAHYLSLEAYMLFAISLFSCYDHGFGSHLVGNSFFVQNIIFLSWICLLVSLKEYPSNVIDLFVRYL